MLKVFVEDKSTSKRGETVSRKHNSLDSDQIIALNLHSASLQIKK